MLRFFQERTDKQPGRLSGIGRREWLRIGGLGGFCWALPGLTPQPAVAADRQVSSVPGFGKARRVILVFASGGQSHIDMWDPKPRAPEEIRGVFDSIDTAIPGIQFSEHMPRIARIADRLCIVRNMSHEDLDHGSAFYLSMTGRYHRRRSGNPLPAPDDAPCHGALLHRVRPATEFVQTAVHLNGPAEVPQIIGPGQFGGLLGKAYDPLTLGDVTQGTIAIPSLQPHSDLPNVRLQARQSLLSAIEDSMKSMSGQRHVLEKNALYQQAFQMLDRPQTRAAFDLSAEPDNLRNRYGRNRSGQACLLARRLVEAGVPW